MDKSECCMASKKVIFMKILTGKGLFSETISKQSALKGHESILVVILVKNTYSIYAIVHVHVHSL